MWTFPPAGSRSRSETIRPGEATQAGPVKVSVKKPAPSHPARAGHPPGPVTRQAVPTESGYDGAAGELAQVPGATSVWGVGSPGPPPHGIQGGGLFRYRGLA